MEKTEVTKPEIGDGMFTFILCLMAVPVIGAIIGVIYGISNVKYTTRMKKARLLIMAAIVNFVNSCWTTFVIISGLFEA